MSQLKCEASNRNNWIRRICSCKTTNTYVFWSNYFGHIVVCRCFLVCYYSSPSRARRTKLSYCRVHVFCIFREYTVICLLCFARVKQGRTNRICVMYDVITLSIRSEITFSCRLVVSQLGGLLILNGGQSAIFSPVVGTMTR